jgi:anti-sigma factor RsiW
MSVTCLELISFLHDYVADELPTEKRKAFEEHLAVCRSCVAYLASYRTTIELEKEAFEDADILLDTPPEELVRAVLAAIRS